MIDIKIKNLLAGISLTTTAQIGKVLAGLILLKTLAVFLTVDEFGLIGNYLSATLFLSILSGGGVQNGIIKFVSEYRKKPKDLIYFIKATKTYMLFFCIIILIGIFFSKKIAVILFNEREKFWAIYLLFGLQFILSYVSLSNGIINGFKNTKKYAKIQIIGSIISSIGTFILLKYWGFNGGIFAILLFYSAAAIPLFLYNSSSRAHKIFYGYNFDWKIFKKLIQYTAMAVVGVVSVPLVEILIRNELYLHVTPFDVGIWQATSKISSAYMGFFIAFLSIYYYPRISSIFDQEKQIHEVGNYIKGIASTFFVFAIICYYLRMMLINLTLSSEYEAVGGFIAYQLVSDFFRITTYVIGFLIVAKSATMLYVIVEILQGVIFYSISVKLINNNMGIQGVFLGGLIMNIIYFILVMSGFLYWRIQARGATKTNQETGG